MRAHLPVVPPDVGVVQADRLQDLGLPGLVVHGPEVGRLEEARVGDGGGGTPG